MSSRVIQCQNVSHSGPIPPWEYKTDSRALNDQYDLDCHLHSQNTPRRTTNGSTSAGKFSPYLPGDCVTRQLLMVNDEATPDLIAGLQRPECHYALYPGSSSTPNAAYCYPFGHQGSIQNPFRWRQQEPSLHGQPCRGCVAVPPEGAASPNTQTLNPQSQMIQHTGHPAHADMTGSSCVKIESQGSPQLQGHQLSLIGQVHYPQNAKELQGLAKTAPATDAKSKPGPIPATTPLVFSQDGTGVQWIAFEYSIDRVKTKYHIRCDIESVDINELSSEFKEENCVYARACCPKDKYRGNRLKYETDCNHVAWGLAQLNIPLRGRRGLLQRAVDSYRNNSQDPRVRSRRVRRLAKKNTPQSFCGLPDRASPQQPQR
ncbi:uncharacterized protein FFNC_15397 [Fusarium fujikuroi]|nr:uncharacterized protein FFNC_15397 [Fusarium fujikuroi]